MFKPNSKLAIAPEALLYFMTRIGRNRMSLLHFSYCTNRSYSPLAVSKGLVIDRVQRYLHGTSVLRCSHASYGVIYNERYDGSKHFRQMPVKNPLDGHNYAVDQIDWFIRRGRIIGDQPIRRQFSFLASS